MDNEKENVTPTPETPQEASASPKPDAPKPSAPKSAAKRRPQQHSGTQHSAQHHTATSHKSKTAQKKRRKRSHRSSGRIFGVLIMLTLIFVISISLAIGIIEVGKDMLGINGTEKLIIFNIPEGATTPEIAEDLQEQGIIRIPKAFVYFSRLSDADSNYIAGDHEISSAMAYEALVKELTGTAITEEMTAVDVMFPEGCTLIDAAQRLEEANVCDSQRFLYYFNAGGLGYQFEEHLPSGGSNLKFMKMEGYLFPDTYNFYEDMEPDGVCQKLYLNFDSKITEEMYDRMDEMGVTLDEVITLASMVQAEAANDEEMPKIASVFWNRLNSPSDFNGKLQSDPTSKYVTQVIKPNVELKNEAMFDAYDTYVCKGLPAGAICNPGLAAINAVLYPANTNFFYFYANIDTHKTYFARTLEEHNENIEKVKQEQAEAATAAAAAEEGEE